MLPINSCSIEIPIAQKSTITDEDGRYQLTQVAAGTYSVSFTAPNYQTQNITQQIKTGTISTLNVQLVPGID